ncbi:uncharacterized protein LOC128577277 isoform X1 [Nycticebus coucang]|uniref:uncharacterized protein LOC128577277 isoform X1 n=1 Tax=Nycticebus coucang TaxID=9470 RepID=UPI00234DB65E|nr:uncharacterized protein LOC128577277 isoform X1 [Nycticebus coucang]
MDVLVSVNSIQVSLYMGILLLPMVVLYFWPQAIIPPQPPKAFGVIKVFSLSSTSQLIHRRLQTCVSMGGIHGYSSLFDCFTNGKEPHVAAQKIFHHWKLRLE